LIRKGLTAGDHLVLTPLGQVSSGTQVKLLNDGREKSLIGSDGNRPDAAGEQSKNGKKAK